MTSAKVPSAQTGKGERDLEERHAERDRDWREALETAAMKPSSAIRQRADVDARGARQCSFSVKAMKTWRKRSGARFHHGQARELLSVEAAGEEVVRVPRVVGEKAAAGPRPTDRAYTCEATHARGPPQTREGLGRP